MFGFGDEEDEPRSVLKQLGDNPKFRGITGLLMIVATLVMPTAGTVIVWGVENLFSVQDRLLSQVSDIRTFLAAAQRDSESVNRRLGELERSSKEQLLEIQSNAEYQRDAIAGLDKRLSLVEQVASDQSRRIDELEEPQATAKLNRRQALKR